MAEWGVTVENNFDEQVEKIVLNLNKKNDIYNRGTKTVCIISDIIMTVIVTSWIWILRNLIVTEDVGYIIMFICAFIIGCQYGWLHLNDTIIRKYYIRHGEKHAAVIVNAEQYEIHVKGNEKTNAKHKEYKLRIKSIQDSQVYSLYGYYLDPKVYLENPYCNLYIYGKKVVASDFKVKDKFISESGYLLKKEKNHENSKKGKC